MLPNQKLHVDPRRSLIVDVLNIGQGVEIALQSILDVPPAGLYLPNQLNPAVVQGKQYWYFIPRLNQFNSYDSNYKSIEKLENALQMPWDIVDENYKVVLPQYLSSVARPHPTMPYFGIKIVLETIDNDIQNTRAFYTGYIKKLEEIVLPYVAQQYRSLEHLQSNHQIHSMINLAYDAMLDVMRPVLQFLRSNPYQICELRAEHLECVRIDQLGDYRIQEWERHQANGTWK